MKLSPVVMLHSATTILLFSCTKPSLEETTFTADKNQIIISGLAHATDSFFVNSSFDWNISIEPTSINWLSVNKHSGPNGSKVITTGVETNTTGADRNATITLTTLGAAAPRSLVVTLIQRPALFTDSASALIGRWKYIRDSSTNIGSYYFLEGQAPWVPIAGEYWGKPEDYWEFRSNGTTEIHANNNTTTDRYKLHPKNRLEITGMLVHDTAYVHTLSANELIFYVSNTSPNGGKYHRRVFLKR